MARTKTKRTGKLKPAKGSFAALQKMEKDFYGTPVKLAAHISKEINALRQRENKLKSTLNKTKAQIRDSENKLKAASQTQHSTVSKKKFKKAKKAHGDVLKTHTDIHKQLTDLTRSIEAAANKHAKLIALRKYLNHFEKEWTKQAKTHAKANVKTKKPRKSKVEMVAPTDEPIGNEREAVVHESFQPEEIIETA